MSSHDRIDNVSVALVREAAAKLGPAIPSPSSIKPKASATSTEPAAGAQQAVQVDEASGAVGRGSAEELFDARSAQTSFMRSKNGVAAGLTKKVQDAARKTAAEIVKYIEVNATSQDHDEYIVAVERLQIILLWLNTETEVTCTGTRYSMATFAWPQFCLA